MLHYHPEHPAGTCVLHPVEQGVGEADGGLPHPESAPVGIGDLPSERALVHPWPFFPHAGKSQKPPSPFFEEVLPTVCPGGQGQGLHRIGVVLLFGGLLDEVPPLDLGQYGEKIPGSAPLGTVDPAVGILDPQRLPLIKIGQVRAEVIVVIMGDGHVGGLLCSPA